MIIKMFFRVLCIVVAGCGGFLLMSWCRETFRDPWGIIVGMLGCMVMGHLIGRASCLAGIWD